MSRKLLLVAAFGALLISVTGCSMQVSGAAGAAGDTAPSLLAPAVTVTDTAAADAAVPAVEGGDPRCGKLPGFFCVTIDITGVTSLSGKARPLNTSPSCADFASGTTPLPGKLPILLNEQMSGHRFSAMNDITSYSGPGTYGKDRLRSPVADGIDIRIDDTPYQPDASSKAEVVINPDGSGRFTFTGFAEAGQGTSNGTIDGTLTWTCLD